MLPYIACLHYISLHIESTDSMILAEIRKVDETSDTYKQRSYSYMYLCFYCRGVCVLCMWNDLRLSPQGSSR